MALTFTVTPGYTIADGEKVTNAKLRLIAKPNVVGEGSIGNSDLATGAVQPNVTKPGAYFHAVITGAANAYAMAPSPAVGSLTDGVIVRGKFTSSTLRNTAGASTLNVNSLGAVALKRTGNGTLLAGDIREDVEYEFQYNSTGGARWEVLNPSNPAVRDGVNNGSTATAYNFTTIPALTAFYDGAMVSVEIPIDSGAAPTLQIDATLAAIRKLNNLVPAPGDLKTNQRTLFVYDVTLGVWMMLTPTAIPDTALAGASRNLQVRVPSVTQATATADEVILRDDSAGVFHRATAVNETAAITASGLNGLDTGVEAANTWYYLWLIYNGTSLDSLLSLSDTAPTMPGGYTYKALVGAVRNNSASDFQDWMEFAERKRFYLAERAVPAAGAKITAAHNLGRVPAYMRVVLVNKTTELNYAVNDEVPITSAVVHVNNPNQPLFESADATNLDVLRWDSDSIFLANKNTGVTSVSITDGNWRIKAYASL
jgi:hypothetical protein